MGAVDGAEALCYPNRVAMCGATLVNVSSTNFERPRSATALVREYGGYVWRTLRLLGVRSADVDDVTQEVMIIATTRQHTRTVMGGLRAWIRGICVNKASAYRRKAHRKREVATALPPEQGTSRRPDDALDESRRLRQLHLALDSLREGPRTAFVLFEIEGLRMKEVASAMGCPLQTAYSRHRTTKAQVVAAMRRAAVTTRGPVSVDPPKEAP